MFNMETILRHTRKNIFCPKSDLNHNFNIEPIRGDNEPCNAKFALFHAFQEKNNLHVIIIAISTISASFG